MRDRERGERGEEVDGQWDRERERGEKGRERWREVRERKSRR